MHHCLVFLLVMFRLSTASTIMSTTSRKSMRSITGSKVAFVATVSNGGCYALRSLTVLAPLGGRPPPFQSRFHNEVEKTVDRVLEKRKDTSDILDLPPRERESLGVARILDARLRSFERNNDCPRCWLQQAHCVCEECPPIPEPALPTNVRRIFLLMHHKEICLAVDTAKMILAAFPEKCRLVVGGIGPEYQESMTELLEAMTGRQRKCLVLFPDESARNFEGLTQDRMNQKNTDYDEAATEFSRSDDEWDVIVIDGTWSQARKLYSRYIPSEEAGGPARVQLSEEAVAVLAAGQSKAIAGQSESREPETSGHQLRRHPVKWREVSTLEATRLLLGDMAKDRSGTIVEDVRSWDALVHYQITADNAARKQLGPPRNNHYLPLPK